MKTIVLCGSMKVKDKMIKVGEKLKTMGFNVFYPEECIKGLPKDVASKAHFKRIIEMADIVLVINERAHDVDNYIGPNTFAEIAFSYYFEKQVYLLNDIYEPFRDELVGWGVKVLNNNLDLLVDKKQ